MRALGLNSKVSILLSAQLGTSLLNSWWLFLLRPESRFEGFSLWVTDLFPEKGRSSTAKKQPQRLKAGSAVFTSRYGHILCRAKLKVIIGLDVFRVGIAGEGDGVTSRQQEGGLIAVTVRCGIVFH